MFAAGATNTEMALNSVMDAIYRDEWNYNIALASKNANDFLELLYGDANYAACYHYAFAWVHLTSVLGFDTRYYNLIRGPNFFLPPDLISSNQQTGNAKETISGQLDRWVFRNHVVGIGPDGNVYDPTFNRSYANVSELVSIQVNFWPI